METEIKYCPECERMYISDDYCIDCAYDDDGLDIVELISLGEFCPDEMKLVKKFESAMQEYIDRVEVLMDNKIDVDRMVPYYQKFKQLLKQKPE